MFAFICAEHHIIEIVSKTCIINFFISSQINTITSLLIFCFQAPLCFEQLCIFQKSRAISTNGSQRMGKEK